MKVTYIFGRDRMQDPVDKTFWSRGESRNLKPEHAAVLLRSTDCWRDPDAPPPPPPPPPPVMAPAPAPQPREAPAGPAMQSIYFTANEAVKAIGEAQYAYFASWGNWLRKASPEDRLRVIGAMVPSFADQGPVSDEELEEMLTPPAPPPLPADTGTFDMSAAPVLQETTQPEAETIAPEAQTTEAPPETPAEPVEEDDDDLDEQIGNMPQLDSMTKAQLIQYTHREFGKELDKSLKIDEMRDRVKQLVNGGRPR